MNLLKTLGLARWLHKARRASLVLGCAAGFAVPALTQAAPHVWSGLVTGVVDGDTVKVRVADGEPPKAIRLDGIDAPEICQSGGAAARQALRRQVLNRQVTLLVSRQDAYGRELATVLLDGEDVGRRLVLLGHAWSYRFQGNAGPYEREELAARAAGRGLFAQGEPEQPRDFRLRRGSCYAPR